MTPTAAAATIFQPLALSLSPLPHTRSLHSFDPLTRPSPIGLPLRVSVMRRGRMTVERRRGRGGRMEVVCYAGVLAPGNLQWISAVSTVVLMLAKGTAINKAFLVPLFALQAPQSIIAWMQGEYGAWSAFLALLVRIFFFTPDDLELPLVTLLLVISAPFRVMSLRSKQEGIIISLVITAYLAFQHFTRVASLRKAFDQGSIIATVAIVCITIVPVLLLV
ncbi:hypothetical protein Droror1_Dr00005577 [Drosera rotundifolia]